MSREIKFRVFDVEDNKMVDDAFIKKFGLFGLVFIAKKNIKVMQYTGLKDKNGVEVYDGDIVVAQTVERSPFSPDYVSGHLKGVIVYYDNSFCILSGGIYYPRWTNAEEIEVIGNIHENKDLLQDVEG